MCTIGSKLLTSYVAPTVDELVLVWRSIRPNPLGIAVKGLGADVSRGGELGERGAPRVRPGAVVVIEHIVILGHVLKAGSYAFHNAPPAVIPSFTVRRVAIHQ